MENDDFCKWADRIEAAKKLAYEAHEGQKRKYSDKPYIVHPTEVAFHVEILNDSGISDEAWEVMIAAAWLHDVLEDCPLITPDDIVRECGESVLRLVQELTNPSHGSQAPRAVRKQQDLQHLAGVSREAKIIKMIDRTCNLQDTMYCDSPKFLKLYLEESWNLWHVIKDAHKEWAWKLMSTIITMSVYLHEVYGISPSTVWERKNGAVCVR